MISMIYMVYMNYDVYDNLLNYIMFIIVMVMSRDIVSYITSVIYVRCKMVTITKHHKFIYYGDIDVIISV